MRYSHHNLMSLPKALLFSVGLALFISGVAILSFHLKDIQFQSPGFDQKEIHIQLREAEEYLRQNSKESARQALSIFNRVLAHNIGLDINQKAKYGVAASLERLEENAAALEYYRELQDQKIQDPKIRNKVAYALGRFYLYLNHEKEGHSLLNALLTRTKSKKLKSNIYTAFGMYYLRRGNSKRAEENFRVALKYDQENLQAEEGRAKAVKGQGRDWTAYRYYDDYLFSTANLNPNKHKEVTNKVEQEIFDSGIKAFRKGNYNNALSFFKKVCIDTKNKRIEENARFWIGESYRKIGMNAKAIKAYNSVLYNSITEKDAVSLFKKAMLFYQAGKLERAAKIFEELHNSYPHSEYSQKAKRYLDEFHKETEEKTKLEDVFDRSDPLLEIDTE